MEDAAPHGPAQAVDVAGGGDGDDVHRGMVLLAQPAQQLEPRHVRQVEVEEREVGAQPVDLLQRLGAGARGAHHAEAGHPAHEGFVQLGHPEVVLHDQGADHEAAMTRAGRRTLKTAPPWLSTSTSPP